MGDAEKMATVDVVCYLCGIVDDRIKQERLIQFNNSAAENKVLGICRALQPHVKHVIAVSTGRGGGIRNGSRFPAVSRRVSNVAVLYSAFWHHALLSHLVTAWSLVCLLFRLNKLSKNKSVCLIAYNRNWIYLPMLCMARLTGARCYLDLEDAPVMGHMNMLKRFLTGLQVKVIDYLCRDGALLANSLLANEVRHERQLVCYGVATKKHPPVVCDQQQPVRVLFGGSLLKETGVQLLIDSVRLLEKQHQDICGKLEIVVTGYGEMLEDLHKISLGDGVSWIDFHGEVPLSKYQSILKSVHVGLCLKLPSSEMCATTFPSKVVEYASFGKVVLSTRIQDVVNLFEDDGAYYVENESAESLAAIFREIALHPDRVGSIAARGQQCLLEKSGSEAVADGIMELLSDEVL